MHIDCSSLYSIDFVFFAVSFARLACSVFSFIFCFWGCVSDCNELKLKRQHNFFNQLNSKAREQKRKKCCVRCSSRLQISFNFQQETLINFVSCFIFCCFLFFHFVAFYFFLFFLNLLVEYIL